MWRPINKIMRRSRIATFLKCGLTAGYLLIGLDMSSPYARNDSLPRTIHANFTERL
jgi:hypothetical protein